MAVLLALIPIMMIFICLFVFKQTSLKASLISYIVCGGIVLLTPIFRLQIGEVMHATFKGGLICFIVGYVLFFGIFLFHLMNKMGYINQVARFMEQVTHDQLLQMLLMCFGICPLIESVSGFGIGFMVAAPIFLSLGYKPFQAVLLSFIGLLASSWGAMATGTIIGSQLINMPLVNLGSRTALLSIPIFAYFVILSLYVVGGWQAVKGKWKEGFGFFLLFSISIYLSNAYVSVELAGILSSIVTITFGFLIIKITMRQGKEMLSELCGNCRTRSLYFKNYKSLFIFNGLYLTISSHSVSTSYATILCSSRLTIIFLQTRTIVFTRFLAWCYVFICHHFLSNSIYYNKTIFISNDQTMGTVCNYNDNVYCDFRINGCSGYAHIISGRSRANIWNIICLCSTFHRWNWWLSDGK